MQLGESADGDLWEAVDLLLERMQGRVEVHWVRGHADKRTIRRKTDEQAGCQGECKLHKCG